ncbi:unnamed protein product [Cochlearia groenlandica]
MGKYIKKSKINGEAIAMMDVSSPSSFGVLTRAQSLALQRRLQNPSSSPPSKQKQHSTADCGGGGSYIQLRSRRLQKKPPPIVVIRRRKQQQRRRKETCGINPNPNPQISNPLLVSIRGSVSDSAAESVVFGEDKCEINKETCFETSFGENFLELEHGNERTTRESTPCSLIRKPEITTSPGSSTKLNNCISDDNSNNNQREESFRSSHRHHLPTTPEMDEFFSGAEEEQQKQFIEKYNFDPVNEQPLPGRFEWKKVDD